MSKEESNKQRTKNTKSATKRGTPGALRHDKRKKRFSLDTSDGHTAILDYEPRGEGEFELYHTEVPEALRGRGVGSEIAAAVFHHFFSTDPDSRLVLTCTFLQHFYRKNAADYADRSVSCE